jgi:hypothetical protein
MTVAAVRNNNPGNIRIGQGWQGLMPRAQMNADQAAETRFCVFLSPEWGFRAMAEIFHTYYRQDGVRTLEQLITRWAPPSENDTGAYIAAVSKEISLAADTPLDFTKSDLMAAICKAIAVHECGGWFFTPADLASGVQLAEAA